MSNDLANTLKSVTEPLRPRQLKLHFIMLRAMTIVEMSHQNTFWPLSTVIQQLWLSSTYSHFK